MSPAETVKTTLAVLAENQGKPFAERMRLLEEEVRPLSARIAEALKRYLVALPLVLPAPSCAAPGGEAGPLVLWPTPELLEATESAAARWTAATGIPILINPKGVPVLYVDGLSADGSPSCGLTSIARYVPSGRFLRLTQIAVSNPTDNCPSVATVLGHELGHALCEHGVDGRHECHAPTGLLRFDAGEGSRIDEASLDAVCSWAHCTAFEPEREVP